MRGRTLLAGTESRSIEVAGRLDPARARALVPSWVPVREDAGGAEVEMLAFRMSGLAPRGLPWIGMDYGEVLFRLGVAWGGGPAWFVVRCALDRAAVAEAAARLMRYPVERVRSIAIDVDGDGDGESDGDDAAGPLPRPVTWRLSATDHRGEVLRASLVREGESSPPPRPVRPVLVGAKGALFRVPWEETAAPRRQEARVTAWEGALEERALGARARWTSAVLHEGRLHRCGVAGPT